MTMLMARTGLIVLLLSAISAAHDLVPPPWRGQDGTTYQQWRFDDADNPALPEVIDNSYGDALAAITVGEFGSGWIEGGPPTWAQQGFWDLGSDGSIVLEIDNRPDPLAYKELWIQVTYLQGPFEQPSVHVPGAEFISEQTVLVAPDPPSTWYLYQSVWRIEPNPAHEEIVILSEPNWGSAVDQIVVDTLCIPEPSCMILLAAGVAAIRRRRS